jgi:hypothetical protein
MSFTRAAKAVAERAAPLAGTAAVLASASPAAARETGPSAALARIARIQVRGAAALGRSRCGRFSRSVLRHACSALHGPTTPP